MATFPKNHDTLYFDALVRTQKAESILSYIQATYHAKSNVKNGKDVKELIAKNLEYAYGLFRDNVKGYDNGVGSYTGGVDQFASQYTLGHEMGIWINSDLDLNPLAIKVAQNKITVRDYLDVVLLNYVQPVKEVCVHPLYQILSFLIKNNKKVISKNDISEALNVPTNQESINALFNILISTNYFAQTDKGVLSYIGEKPIEKLIKMCNITYVGKDGYEKAKVELTESAYSQYIVSVHEIIEDDNSELIFIENEILKEVNDYSLEELASILSKMYDEADANTKSNAIRMFGFKYAKIISSLDIAPQKIVDMSSIDSSTYGGEITKGINMANSVRNKEYGLSFFEPEKNLGLFDYDLTKGNAKNIIFYGTPGCGKSYHVQHNILEKEGYAEENIIRTTFYQDYTNTDFVGQILPKVTKNKDGNDVVEYIFNPGPFTLSLIQAIKNPKQKIALVIEEINRGNAPAIFGDVFQLLDRNNDGISEYGIKNINVIDFLNFYNFSTAATPKYYCFNEIKIPGNLTIYATMNTSDQNVFTLDTAFKRRWEFEKIRNKFDVNHSFKGFYIPGIDNKTWEDFVTNINDYIVNRGTEITAEDKQLGVYFVKKEMLCSTAEEAINASGDAKKKFAYKVFEYLWDDVAKFAREDWFGREIKTLDDLIDKFVTNGKQVFVNGVLK